MILDYDTAMDELVRQVAELSRRRIRQLSVGMIRMSETDVEDRIEGARASAAYLRGKADLLDRAATEAEALIN